MKKIASLIMALCVMTLVSCSSGGAGGKNTPTKAVKEYLDCLKSEKFSKSLTYFDGVPEVESAEMEALAGKMEESMKEQGGLKSFVLVEGGETISECGETATVEAVLTYGNGNIAENTFNLKKVDGEWKIDLMSGK